MAKRWFSLLAPLLLLACEPAARNETPIETSAAVSTEAAAEADRATRDELHGCSKNTSKPGWC